MKVTLHILKNDDKWIEIEVDEVDADIIGGDLVLSGQAKSFCVQQGQEGLNRTGESHEER